MDVIETWRSIPGWEGIYQASTLGRVRSVDRTVPHGRHGPTRYRGRVLKASGRYPQVQLVYGPRREPWYVHDAVLATFVGPKPEGLECCHNDGDPTNNCLSNLRYDTRSSNGLDRTQHGYTPPRGRATGHAKLTEEIVRELRRSPPKNLRAKARELGVAHTTLRHALTGMTWGWL